MTFVQSLVQNLRRRVALCSHFRFGRDFDLVGVTAESWHQNEKKKKKWFDLWTCLTIYQNLDRSNSITSSRHSPDKLDCQSEVSYTARPVSFHQYVLTLQVPVSDGRFALGAEDLGVEVTEARHGGVSQPQHGFVVQSGWFEVVVQGAILMVVSDQVELGPGARSFNISSNKTWGRSGRRIKSVTDEELHSSVKP